MRGWGPRIVALLLLAGGWLLAGLAPAQAHAYLVGSNPADGGRVREAPAQLRLQFSEHVVLGATHVEITSGSGRRVRVGRVRVESGEQDLEAPSSIVARLPRLGQDTYRVSWETLSADDLHRTAGLLVFGVGRTAQPMGAGSVTLEPRSEEALLRGGLLIAAALAAGGTLALHVLRRAARGGRGIEPSPMVTVAQVAAWSAPAFATLLLLDQLLNSGSGPAAVLLGGYGARWALRMAGLVILALAWSRAPGPSRVAATSGVALTALGTTLLGHIGSGGSHPTLVLASAAHVAAALLWGGAVACLAVALLSGGESTASSRSIAALRAFGAPAGCCLTVVVVTGVYLSSDVVGSVDAALFTPYGRTLLLKVGLVAAAALLGLRHHRHVRSKPAPALPRSGLLSEASLLLVVLAMTGVLASTGTATDPSLVRSGSPAVASLSRQVVDLQVTTTLTPDRPGDVVAVVDVFDTRRPAPGPITGVDVEVRGAPSRPAQAAGDGHWTVPVSVPSGAVPLTVTVHRAGLADARGPFTLHTRAAAQQPVRVSQEPVGTPLRLLAAALALLAACGWGWVGLRRARSVRDGSLRTVPAPVVERWDEDGHVAV